ncbi:MAG: cupin domain-containing protein [Patescibacteria group bacterium]|jgi:mannose-6-phosphate isomerase-like protein (cupin superfamily)
MKGYVADIGQETKTNTNFRKVLYTGHHSQLVLMSLKPGEDIGAEVHPNVDQFFRFEQGTGQIVIDASVHEIKAEFAAIVPAGAEHNVINTGTEDLRLYTIYSPAEHQDGIARVTKADAIAQPEEFDGKTTE